MNSTHIYGWLQDVIIIANTVEKFSNYTQCPYCNNSRDYNAIADELHHMPMYISYAEGEEVTE